MLVDWLGESMVKKRKEWKTTPQVSRETEKINDEDGF